MCHINNLVKFFICSFSILGIIGCGSDNSDSENNSAWQLNEPDIIQPGHEPMKFKQAENTLSEYSMADAIQFSPKNITQTTLLVKTECYLNEKVLSRHQFQEPMNRQYFFYQLLSESQVLTLLTSPSSKFNCHFDFLAQNSSGQKHHFKTRNVLIKPSMVASGLSISHLESLKSTKLDRTFGLSREDLRSFAVDGWPATAAKIKLVCPDAESEVLNEKSPIALNRFDLPARNIEASAPALPCVFVKLSGANKIEKLSPLFFITPTLPKFRIQNIKTESLGYVSVGSKQIIASYRIQNISNFSVDISIDAVSDNLLSAVYLTPTLNRGLVGHTIDQKVDLLIRGGQINKTERGTTITLDPFQQTQVDAQIVPKRVVCDHQRANGLILTTTRQSGIVVKVSMGLPKILVPLQEFGYENISLLSDIPLGEIYSFGSFKPKTTRSNYPPPPPLSAPAYNLLSPNSCL